jgi:RNA-directed DNA polymerase
MPVEQRGLSSRRALEVVRGRGLGNLSTPNSVQALQTALHAKAKTEPEYRFYALYDKMYRKDVLEFAYRCCRANKGAAGVDAQTFQDIERNIALSRRRATFNCRALSALVDRVICRKHITS